MNRSAYFVEHDCGWQVFRTESGYQNSTLLQRYQHVTVYEINLDDCPVVYSHAKQIEGQLALSLDMATTD